ncbi:MAG: hypothetical protein E7L02_11070 [Cutibacterium avidum]|uniref:hypothetical protein n=1 Tax=Cutibacterium avidum TaxID=33010 RepID=UPI0003B82278|nr:hypothetical protein [Cutibacterium avidum]ERS24567.1 hypothetical protein HMPREF1301_00558 [Propionibacterium sp. KPL2005]ERS29453.1 hypothetical protein HMPREF1297_00267 [Propionibacterium sp. KPL2000]MCG7370900.1 hypothetical protein [Cutibacterium avidum]MDU7388073.1 hypothetical protein [Cutibacterium avidum]MDY0818307.1 hypothetical protein [Cutibacterium avidum]
MGIHDNTTTNKDQYRRAPLNGLIIGTIVGAAWAIEFLLPFLFPMGRYSRNIKMAFIALALPVLGWITGLWGRTAYSCTTSVKKKRRVKTTGIIMTTTIGVLMSITFYSLVADMETFEIPDNATFSCKAFVMFLAPLFVFPITGWGLSIARINTPSDRHSVISKMSAWVALGLYLSTAAWFAISLFLNTLFFFEF